MLEVTEQEQERWKCMTAAERQSYTTMGDYLSAEYGDESVSLADVDSAWAIGA